MRLVTLAERVKTSPSKTPRRGALSDQIHIWAMMLKHFRISSPNRR
jgi:hypothetical protein